MIAPEVRRTVFGSLEYYMPTRVLYGAGKLGSLPGELKSLNPHRTFMIADPATKETGLLERLAGCMETGGLPHGLVNGIMLPFVLRYTLPVVPERLLEVARSMAAGLGRKEPVEDPGAALGLLSALYNRLGFKAQLPGVVRETDLERLADLAVANPLSAFHARRANKDEIVELYRSALCGL